MDKIWSEQQRIGAIQGGRHPNGGVSTPVCVMPTPSIETEIIESLDKLNAHARMLIEMASARFSELRIQRPAQERDSNGLKQREYPPLFERQRDRINELSASLSILEAIISSVEL